METPCLLVDDLDAILPGPLSTCTDPLGHRMHLPMGITACEEPKRGHGPLQVTTQAKLLGKGSRPLPIIDDSDEGPLIRTTRTLSMR